MQKGSDEISNRDSKKTGELGSSRLVNLSYYRYYNNNNYYCYSFCRVTRRGLFDSRWEEMLDARLLPMCTAQAFLLSLSTVLGNTPHMWGWVGTWVKPLFGVSFAVLYLMSPFPSLPFSWVFPWQTCLGWLWSLAQSIVCFICGSFVVSSDHCLC